MSTNASSSLNGRSDTLAMRGLKLTALAAGAVLAVRGIARLARRIEFRDRVVVLTGGSRGLGLAMARQLAAAGAKLVICAPTKPRSRLHALSWSTNITGA